MIFRDQETGAPVFIMRRAINKEYIKIIMDSALDDDFIKASHVTDGEKSTDVRTRDSQVRFFNDLELSRTLWSFMNAANYHMGLRYKITGHEYLQFTQYKTGGHYGWHTDGDTCHYSVRNFTAKEPKNLQETVEGNLVGTVRKISCSVVLNDDFEGGEFQTRFNVNEGEDKGMRVQTIKPQAGDVYFFAADQEHRVKPVTKGTRYSVVVWFAGPPLV